MDKKPFEDFGLHHMENNINYLELLPVKHVITSYREIW